MKKLLNFIVSILIFGCTIVAQETPKIITIDVSRNNKLNIAQIAEKVTLIPLHFPDIDEPAVSKVLITPDYLYVRVSDRAIPDSPRRNYQIKWDGTIIKEIGMKDTQTGEFINSVNLFYSESDHELVTIYNEFLAIFDGNGKSIRRIDGHFAKIFYQFYNKKIWNMETKIDRKNNWYTFQLTTTNLMTFEVDSTIYYYKHFISEGERMFLGTNFSIANNTLYFTNDYENEIIGINNNDKIEQTFRFNYENVKKSLTTTFIRPQRIMFNKYIYYGYNNGPDAVYLFLYNKVNGENYNIRIRWNANHNLISGIKDDVFETGYLDLKETNSGDYAYDVKQGYEVSEIIDGIKDESDPVLFLIKLK